MPAVICTNPAGSKPATSIFSAGTKKGTVTLPLESYCFNNKRCCATSEVRRVILKTHLNREDLNTAKELQLSECCAVSPLPPHPQPHAYAQTQTPLEKESFSGVCNCRGSARDRAERKISRAWVVSFLLLIPFQI